MPGFLQSAGSPEKRILNFFVKLILIWISWKIILLLLGEEGTPLDERVFPAISNHWESFNASLVEFLFGPSRAILEGMGYVVHTRSRLIWIDETNGLSIGNYCLGIQLMYYNTLLILISSMSRLRKTIGILAGIGITMSLNIMRIVTMCILSLHRPGWMDYAHDHIFNIIVFGTLMTVYYGLVGGKNLRLGQAS